MSKVDYETTSTIFLEFFEKLLYLGNQVGLCQKFGINRKISSSWVDWPTLVEIRADLSNWHARERSSLIFIDLVAKKESPRDMPQCGRMKRYWSLVKAELRGIKTLPKNLIDPTRLYSSTSE